MLALGRYDSAELMRGLTQVGLGLGISAAAYGLTGFHFRSFFSYLFRQPSRDGWKLDLAPTSIGWIDCAFILVFGVLRKSISSLFRRTLDVKGRDTVELPRLDIRCPVEYNQFHRDLYSKAVPGVFSELTSDPFLLASLTNQLMLLLVVHPRLPVSPLGSVNVRNRIEFYLDSPQWKQEALTAHAFVGGKDDVARVTHRGIEFDVHIHISIDSNSWPVLKQTITILSPCKTGKPHPPPAQSLEPEQHEFTSLGAIDMKSHSPSTWSRVTGDYNPIHVSSLLARLFGFKGKIAHGNHVVARFIPLVPFVDMIYVNPGYPGWWIEMKFKRPMVLPIKLQAQIAGETKAGEVRTWRCIGERDDKVYVAGAMGPVDPASVRFVHESF